MAYFNQSVADKAARAQQLITNLGAGAFAMFYSGPIAQSPDILVSGGNLLGALPCSSTVGAIVYAVQNAAVVTAGSGGTNGTQVVTGTTGTGTKFQANVTISGGAITSVNSIALGGTYSVLPSNLNNEPVTGGGLTGAVLSLAMTAGISLNPVTTENAVAGGVASFCRFATSNAAGAAGIIDLDVGTSNASIIVNTTSFASGGPIVLSGGTIFEA